MTRRPRAPSHERPQRRLCGITLLLFAAPLGCTGQISDPGSSGSDAGIGDTTPGEPTYLELPASRVWRLNPVQYERSFVAAFGTTTVTQDDFVVDSFRDGFNDVAAQNHVDIAWAELVQQNAAAVAAELAPELVASQPCLAEDAPSPACIGAIVDDYGSRAYRRPIDPASREAFVDLFLALRANDNSAQEAIAAILEAIAQSPYFLYRIEIGEPLGEGVERLDDYSIAAQLAYMLTDSPPDEELMAAAADGLLTDREVVSEQALRLLDTPEALQKVSRFFDQYLGLHGARENQIPKDPEVYPEFTAEIQAAMLAETDRFVERIAFAEDATLYDVFTAPITYIDDSLREFYGWQGSASPDTPFTISDEERAGIFMQGSFLTTWSQSTKTDVLHRGLYIYQRLLCQNIAPPPGLDIFEVADLLEPPDPESTERERLEYIVENVPGCGSCHDRFVSLGLSLETFDAVGVFRDEQNGRPLDPSGELAPQSEPAAPYANAVGLLELLSRSRQAQACFAENWATFALGEATRVPTSSTLVDAFQARDLRIRDLMMLLTQDDAFYLRRVEDSE